MNSARLHSPLGDLLALEEEGVLAGLYFTDSPDCPALPQGGHLRSSLLLRLQHDLDRYFEGELRSFDVPLQVRGTPFQSRVWAALQGTSFGTTVSYGELAHQVSSPRAARAVGGAVGSNPWVIVVPCHRVLAGGGRLGGFSSGLDRKRALLRLEGIPWRD